MKKKVTVKLGNKKQTVEYKISTGFVDYSGYGYHKNEKKDNIRKKNKEEERKANRGDFDH